MNKGTVWALVAMMILSASAYGKEKSGNRRHTIFPPVTTSGDGKILGAKYNEETGKIDVTILTDSWCNSFSAKLVATFAGRATFGPFHFNLVFGPQTQMACIPNIEKEKVISVDAPNVIVKNEARIVIHGENKTFAQVTIDNRQWPADDLRVTDQDGNLTSDSKVDGMPIGSVDPGTAEALELESTGAR
jgi:hypothetical protein